MTCTYLGEVTANDCYELHQRHPNYPSGVYFISPPGMPTIKALCDMDTDGGGYTVIQRLVLFRSLLLCVNLSYTLDLF